MNTLQKDRRTSQLDMHAYDESEKTEIVHQAILLQAGLGRGIAVEYLNAYRIDRSVIARALAGQQMRQEDRSALAHRAENMAS
jgi:hypothetical protein